MAHGICFEDDRYGVWTGTFVDASHREAVEECIKLAYEILGEEEELPPDARIVAVDLVVNERETERLEIPEFRNPGDEPMVPPRDEESLLGGMDSMWGTMRGGSGVEESTVSKVADLVEDLL